ncbi:MAG TPA: hypothetical protein PLZ74_01855, partial [Kiritimatiellia bacterium]|nr:hypothetical protein [Kiritimatiellia bacterium]
GGPNNLTVGKEGRIIVPKVEFEEDPNQNYGFDPDGPWVSVEKAKTTTVKVNISPSSAASQIYFTSSDASRVTVSPSRASGPPQILTLTAGDLEGDSAVIEARIGSAMGQSCTNLGVAVYEKTVVATYVHAVNGFTGIMPFTEANNILKQAVVQIDNVGAHNCSHDLSAGYASDVDMGYAEHESLLNNCHMAIGSTHLQDIYMIPTPGKIRLADGQIKMGVHCSDKFPNIGTLHWNIISQDASLRSRYLAHEIFHMWSDHLNLDDNLMHENEMSMGNTLKKSQWDLAH